jgi:hypothetical protein
VSDDPWPLPCPWFVGPVKPTPEVSLEHIRVVFPIVPASEFAPLARIAKSFLRAAPTIAKAAFDFLGS